MTLGAALKHEVRTQHMQQSQYFPKGTRKLESTTANRRPSKEFKSLESPRSQKYLHRKFSAGSFTQKAAKLARGSIDKEKQSKFKLPSPKSKMRTSKENSIVSTERMNSDRRAKPLFE